MPPASIQGEWFADLAAPRDAVDFFAEAPAEARGAVHTRPEVARFILDLAGWTSGRDLAGCRLLEPSAGEGDFLLPAAERLLEQVRPGQADAILPCIRAAEVSNRSLELCRTRLSALFRRLGWRTPQIRTVLDAWLVQADFLTMHLGQGFTHVVGNPPYVRLEALPKELLKVYRARWASLFDRADLYVAFIERSLGLLAPNGRVGFICADRWMKNRYGGPLRAMVSEGFHLDVMVDFTGCPAFLDEVDAYPAVVIIRRGLGTVTRVAFRPEVSEPALKRLSQALLAARPGSLVRQCSGITQGAQPWMFDEEGSMEVLRPLEARLPALEAAGCKVGIGVATGADAVYIGTETELDVEPVRRLPLVMTRDIRGGRVDWMGHWVLNPFHDDGALVDPAEFPRFQAYIERHRAVLRQRNVAVRNPRGWFRTIDRIHAGLTCRPKLLIPDIKGRAHVVYESGKYYPHHNLYYVLSDVWDLHALRAVLCSRVGRAFVAAYSPRMRGGFLRFQAQYLRRIRLPDWHKLDAGLRLALAAAGKSADPDAGDEAVRTAYALDTADWKRLQPEPARP